MVLVVGKFMNIDLLILMMIGSILMIGGYGNVVLFVLIVVDVGVLVVIEVVIVVVIFGLILGCMFGGFFGNFLVKRFKLEGFILNE